MFEKLALLKIAICTTPASSIASSRPLAHGRVLHRQDLLDHYRRSADPDVRLRAHILLLLDAGHPWATISAVLFCSTSTISRWKRRFEKDGADAVFGRPRGRRRSGVHIWATLVVRWVLTLSPTDFRFARSRWSCEAVAVVLREDYRVTVGRETVRLWLRDGRPGVAAAPPDHPPEGPGPGEEAAGLAGVAQGPAGGRDGGVHGRGGREPEPEGRVHVDEAGRAGGRRDAGEQREAVPGREHPLADRAGHPDRGEAEGGAVGGPVPAGTWTTCGGRSGTTRSSTSCATTPGRTRPRGRSWSGRTWRSGGTG